MQIITDISNLNISEKTSVALGNFDGLHVGHRKIMEDAINSARKSGFKSLCFTFSNHPFNFIMRRNENDPDALKLICSEDEKIRLIEDMGFDILVNMPFDEYIMTMKAEAFFSEIIAGRLNAGCVSVGFNYSYGARAGGNADTLRAACAGTGIDVNIHDAVMIGDKVVSSTLIREMIKTGDMEMTALYLGRPYDFKGRVTHGKKLGSAMGIPTVNIPVPTDIMLPPNGVYFSRINIDGTEYKSVSNIGVRPTVSNAEANIRARTSVSNAEANIRVRTAASNTKPFSIDDDTASRDSMRKTADEAPQYKNIETNIFDFNGDLYGKDIIVYFDHFSRGEMKFDSKEQLFEQIGRDCRDAKAYHRE